MKTKNRFKITLEDKETGSITTYSVTPSNFRMNGSMTANITTNISISLTNPLVRRVKRGK